jgi:hypothetical protein
VYLNFHLVSEWGLLLNANSAIFQLFHGENKLIFNEMMMRSALYSTNAHQSPLMWVRTMLPTQVLVFSDTYSVCYICQSFTPQINQVGHVTKYHTVRTPKFQSKTRRNRGKIDTHYTHMSWSELVLKIALSDFLVCI